LKVGLLAILPALLIRSGAGWTVPPGWWHWAGPAVATGGWLALAWLGPFARPFEGDAPLVAVIGAFLLNSVLEESFYRVTLQTRLERVVGRWPGIAAAALLWAAWHVAIQGTDRPEVDLATVVAHQGALGLFLGYLWSRYRNPWALFIVHGAINAPLALLVSTT
jgi:membrane protease YdiL (CAAX protease family)